jgi:hypothetical protein
MAVGVAAAWAATWDVLGTGSVPAQVDFKEIEALPGGEPQDGMLKFNIGAASVKIVCTSAELNGVELEAAGKVRNGGTAMFKGCSTFVNGVAAPNCQAKTPGQANGTILSLSLKGLLELRSGAKITLIEPSTGTEFLTIETGETCSVTEAVVVRGKLAIKDTGLETSSLDHLISEETTNSTLTANGNVAKIVGSALVKLVSPGDADQNWRGLAE